jgi:hypothetical protein
MFLRAPQIEIGDVLVSTTENKGHDPEFWAQVAADKIVSVGNITAGRSIQRSGQSYSFALHKRSSKER